MIQPEFLRVPPFPGSRHASLTFARTTAIQIADDELDRMMGRIAELRVGGESWGAQPELPAGPYSLINVREPRARAAAIASLSRDRSILIAEAAAASDPWHLVSGAAEAIVDADDEIALVAALAGVPVRCIGDGPFATLEGSGRAALRAVFRRHALKPCVDPFTGAAMNCGEAVELLGFWRRQIDSNRDLTGAVGFAPWKRQTVAPLLWGGSTSALFAARPDDPKPSDRIAVWKSRVAPAKLVQLQRSGAQLIEVEDGFIRSVGLGADCVPPLSVVVDYLGIYFDPSEPSTLERLLQDGEFGPSVLQRAAQLRKLVVDHGITKYGVGQAAIDRPATRRRLLLVVGQVEDDRAVIAGLGPPTNLKLLEQVRNRHPEAYLIYKPHPDVEAGHRKGGVAGVTCLRIADEIVRDVPISSLIDLVDEIHVNTSLAGFEALLRGKAVTTYGVPFYAGWGLTNDVGPVPARRTGRRSLDELVAAALLLYPRYLDPVTRLPCPPEILVRRLGEARRGATPTPLSHLRRLQGRLKRTVASLRRAS